VFAQHPVVARLLKEAGPGCLPLVFAGSELISRDTYPTRQQFVELLPTASAAGPASVPVTGSLQIIDSGCTPGTGCC
jgi:hypothetical protein